MAIRPSSAGDAISASRAPSNDVFVGTSDGNICRPFATSVALSEQTPRTMQTPLAVFVGGAAIGQLSEEE
jgi:hypothetical protein